MSSGRSVLVYFLTGIAIFASIALAGLLTGNPLTSALVAVAWAGVLARRFVGSSKGDAPGSPRVEDVSVRYRQQR